MKSTLKTGLVQAYETTLLVWQVEQICLVDPKLVKVDPVSISLKVICYTFYILRHEKVFQYRVKW